MSTATIKINQLRHEITIASIPPSRLADILAAVDNELNGDGGDDVGGSGSGGSGSGSGGYPMTITVSESCEVTIGSTTQTLSSGTTTVNADSFKVWVSNSYEGDTLVLDFTGITLQNGDLVSSKMRIGRAKSVKIKANTSSLTSLANMFTSDNEYVKHLDLSSLNTSNVTSMMGMFHSCTRLETLDVSSFDITKVANCTNMFFSCLALAEIKCTVAFKTWALANAETNKLPEHVFFDTGETISWSQSTAPTAADYPHGGVFVLTGVCAGISPLSKSGETWKMTVNSSGQSSFNVVNSGS